MRRDAAPVTIAFLASGIEGIKVRLTAKAANEQDALAALDAEEVIVRAAARHAGVRRRRRDHGARGRGIAARTGLDARRRRIADRWNGRLALRRGYRSRRLVPRRDHVLRQRREVQRPRRARPAPSCPSAPPPRWPRASCAVVGTDVGLSLTGVAGPDEQDGQPVGTVFFGLSIAGKTEAIRTRLPGDRQRVRAVRGDLRDGPRAATSD